jgi:electron transport complex protein RnfG
MKEILSMILVLSLICGVSGFSLATLKAATRDKIEEQVLTYVQGPALMHVVGPHENDPIVERVTISAPDVGEVVVFPVVREGELTGVALESAAPGYSGDIGVMVGFDIAEDTLLGIGITTQTETPGLGTRVTEPSFTGQFRAHAPSNLDLGSDIDGVSGATFSSKGTVDAVKKAVALYTAHKDEMITALQQSGGQS